MKIIDFGVRFAQISKNSISKTSGPIPKNLSVLKCYDLSLQAKNTSKAFPEPSNLLLGSEMDTVQLNVVK